MTGDIYIWDNGCDYSDHAIYFVDADGLTPEEMEKAFLVYCRDPWRANASVVGHVQSIEWRDGDPESVFNFLRFDVGRDSSGRARSILGPELWAKFTAKLGIK